MTYYDIRYAAQLSGVNRVFGQGPILDAILTT